MRISTIVPASLAAAALAFGLAPQASAEILVNIDKSSQSMTVTVDGTPRYIWPVSTGRAGYDTPNGTFKPNRMDADHLSQEWDNAPMPHTIFFDLHGHAIHGFLDTRRLGSAASHGCVRLAPENASVLYALVEAQGMKDTTVIVSGHAPTGAEIARRGSPIAPVEETATQPPLQIAPSSGLMSLFGPQTAPSEQAVPYGQQQVQQPQPAPPPVIQRGLFGQPLPPPPTYYVQSSNGRPVYYQVQPGYPPPPPPPQYYPYSQ
jgi:hypothetical protein